MVLTERSTILEVSMGVGSGAAGATPIICTKKKKRGGKEKGGEEERGQNMGRE